jgi:predicted DNA binding CopG/RHH family protein
MTTKSEREKMVTFRASEHEKAELKKHAAAQGMSLSVWLRALIFKELKLCKP